MANVMEAVDQETVTDQTEYVIYTPEGPHAIYKLIPSADIPNLNQARAHVVIESAEGGWRSTSGRPAFNVPTGNVKAYTPPTEWGSDMMTWRMRQLQWTGGWNDERRAKVTASLQPFLQGMARGEYTSAEAAGKAAEQAVLAGWPTWTGTRTHDGVVKLGQDIYNSTWRIDPDAISIRDRVTAFPGTDGQGRLSDRQREVIIHSLEQMKTEDLSFASDGARWKALHDRAKKVSTDWHMVYSDVQGSLALRDLMRDLWPNNPSALPPEIQALTEAEAKAQLYLERDRTRHAHEELWRKAEERGWCPEFDAILIRAGYPPRPATYLVKYSVKYTKTMTPDEVRQMTGYTLTFANGAVVYENAVNLQHTFPSEDPLTKDAARELLTPDILTDDWGAHIGGVIPDLVDADVMVKSVAKTAGRGRF
jgi:hypothetical protein